MQPGLKYSSRLRKSETNEEKKKNGISLFHLSYIYILGFLSKELWQSCKETFKKCQWTDNIYME